jgi:hypothetical protein
MEGADTYDMDLDPKRWEMALREADLLHWQKDQVSEVFLTKRR